MYVLDNSFTVKDAFDIQSEGLYNIFITEDKLGYICTRSIRTTGESDTCIDDITGDRYKDFLEVILISGVSYAIITFALDYENNKVIYFRGMISTVGSVVGNYTFDSPLADILRDNMRLVTKETFYRLLDIGIIKAMLSGEVEISANQFSVRCLDSMKEDVPYKTRVTFANNSATFVIHKEYSNIYLELPDYNITESLIYKCGRVYMIDENSSCQRTLLNLNLWYVDIDMVNLEQLMLDVIACLNGFYMRSNSDSKNFWYMSLVELSEMNKLVNGIKVDSFVQSGILYIVVLGKSSVELYVVELDEPYYMMHYIVQDELEKLSRTVDIKSKYCMDFKQLAIFIYRYHMQGTSSNLISIYNVPSYVTDELLRLQ